MKKFFVFVCLTSLLVLCGYASAKRAKSIDELAARYDSSSCKECHEEIYEQWEKSGHAHLLWGTGGRYAATLKSTITRGLMKWPYSGVKKPQDVKMKHLWGCFQCSLPQAKEADDKVAKEIVKAIFNVRIPKNREKLKKLNINCLVCHQLKAIIHKWTYGPVEKNVIYGSHDGEHPCEEYPILKKSPYMDESIFCGQCHGLGPTHFGLEQPTQCPTLYGYYLYSYIPKGGHETCQDCHMKKFNKGHQMPAYKDPDMRKAAIDFDVDAYSFYWRNEWKKPLIPLAVVKVKMTNKAGHGFPDGCPTPNRLVLDIRATTPNGKEIYKESKIYTPHPARFGNRHVMGRGAYDKNAMISDTTPAPFETITETFKIPFPYKDIKKGKKTIRKLLSKEMNLDIELWYLPFGRRDVFPYQFRQVTKKISIVVENVPGIASGCSGCGY